jgi:TonB-linked SusC/RagA family outer membrane protein
MKAQNVEVTGTVQDNTGPLPGVTIVVKGTNTGATTDFDGNYQIGVPGPDAVLVASFVGYKTEEVRVGSKTNIDFILKEDVDQLDEVVIIGYGSVKKSDLTGSVASINTENINNQASANVSQFLQGKAAGVQVVENSGAPGAGVDIQIRGTNSINASSKPLYVIDGMPYEADAAAGLNDTYSGGFVSSPMANLNPNDIASIEILKDASATAIYGSRGANGVVLITTKSGKEGKAKVSINISSGVSQVAKKIELLNGQQYAELANEAAEYRYGGEDDFKIPFTEEELNNLPNFDHQEEVFQLGEIQDVNLSVSGGTESSKYYVSGQYFDQTGVFPGSGFEKMNVNINLEQSITDKLIFNANAKILKSVSNGSMIGGWSGGLIQNTLIWAPTTPMVREDGSYIFIPGYTIDRDGNVKERFAEGAQSTNTFVANPLSILKDYETKNTSNQELVNLDFTYKFNDKLNLRAKYGYSNYQTLLQSYRATTVILQGSNEQGFASIGNSSSKRTLYETTLSYNNDLGKHHVDGVIGLSAEEIERTNSKASAWGFLQDVTGYNDIGAATAPQPTLSSYDSSSLASALGRINYHYNYKYYATFSARYDGSSKFAKGNRWGFFPSLGLSWRMNKENFLADIEDLSELKLRASTGVAGNQSIPSYQTLGQYFTEEDPGRTNFNFGNNVNVGYAPVRIANKDLTWEETQQTNIGVDLGLFKNRFILVADIYRKDTKNLLFYVDIPSTSGFPKVFQNIGELRNEGLELALTTVNLKSKDFEWSTSANISWNKNNVKKLSGKEGEKFIAGQVFDKPISILEVGSPIGEFYGYKTDGIWSEEEIAAKPSNFMPGARAGDRKFLDVNEDGVLNIDDRIVIGSAMPKFIGGFNTNLTYKNWELYGALSFSYGNDMFNELSKLTLAMYGGVNVSIDALDRWRPITDDMTATQREEQLAFNSITNIPRAGSYSQTTEVSDAYIEDASYIRLNNLSLSYTLPKSLLDKLSVSNTRLTGSVENLFTISKYSGYSPVGNSRGGLVRGLDSGLYPTMRTFKLTLSISL